MHGVIEDSIEPGSTVYTDEHKAYTGLSEKSYRHESVEHSAGEYVKYMPHTNGIESMWSVVKRGFVGVYHQWSMKNLQAYIDEFTFRLNEGNVEIDTQDRLDVLFRKRPNKLVTYSESAFNPA